MANKNSVTYTCQICGFQSPKWVGKCSDCQEWNSFEEQTFSSRAEMKAHKRDESREIEGPKRISEIDAETYTRCTSGIGEFDRVLGGGLVQGSLILIGGEPGIGKSTLLTELLSRLTILNPKNSILYVSGEESNSQVANRSKRLGLKDSNFYIYNETNWQRILKQIKKLKPKFMVLDSIQTTTSSEIQSAPGTVSQIREVTYELMNHVKSHGITCFVVGHITKEGSIAGPKILEHMVDTVIYFEGDQFGHYRMLRAIKNRFGNTNEVGIFEMKENGLKEVLNPSQYFLDENLRDVFGRSLSCINEGSRPLFVEIQALVIENKFGNGRRTTQGIESNRLSMLVAVIEKYLDLPLGYNDIFLNVVGGIKLVTRDTDLSIIASLISSFQGKYIDSQTIFLGEVGLTGEVRSVTHFEKRLAEMEQLNYKRLVTSYKLANEFKGKTKIQMRGIKTIKEIEKMF
ncbi:DNA repair protein RadA [Halobacteriovorax marinus]|uniref:DNA repair protein RadA n=1 Tax=Halobacteriovorax marinus TaxID=97084 RepID=A0A1Y5F595_9BACT|nr:DNA repair protein RadA [Halobacteriovorax marinus]